MRQTTAFFRRWLLDGLRPRPFVSDGKLPSKWRLLIVNARSTTMLIDTLLRRLPLSCFMPLRKAVAALPRRHPLRLAATLVLQRAAKSNQRRLAGHLSEIRPLDAPHLSFEAVDSMVMDAIFWFGVRGYEGTVARVWIALCQRSHAVLEIGGNVGLFTVLGARETSGIYTVVEPVPANAAIIRANLARNEIVSVDLLQAAVVAGEHQRNVFLNVPDEGRDAPVGAHLVGDDVEVKGRTTLTHLTVTGIPIAQLAQGRDLIKIDAEGIEAALLHDIRPLLLATRPALLVEVLPEAARLGEFLADLAQEAGYHIYILPEYGSDIVVAVAPRSFTAASPKIHNSKDVLLSVHAIS